MNTFCVRGRSKTISKCSQHVRFVIIHRRLHRPIASNTHSRKVSNDWERGFFGNCCLHGSTGIDPLIQVRSSGRLKVDPPRAPPAAASATCRCIGMSMRTTVGRLRAHSNQIRSAIAIDVVRRRRRLQNDRSHAAEHEIFRR